MKFLSPSETLAGILCCAELGGCGTLDGERLVIAEVGSIRLRFGVRWWVVGRR
jgi:hypothetical protein